LYAAQSCHSSKFHNLTHSKDETGRNQSCYHFSYRGSWASPQLTSLHWKLKSTRVN
jgi:hypothetical protein